jgi:hypothetical protein
MNNSGDAMVAALLAVGVLFSLMRALGYLDKYLDDRRRRRRRR